MLVVAAFLVAPVAVASQEPANTADDGVRVRGDVSIGIRPQDKADGERFEALVEPGETVQLVSVMSNFGDEPVGLRTYTSDLIPVVNGGLRMAHYEDEHTGVTSWIDYPVEVFELQPGESAERPVTITVPEGTPSGQYVGAIALETTEPVNAGEGAALDQYFRKVVSVYITVPGDLVTDFTLGDPEVRVVYGQASVIIPVANTGNIRIDLGGRIYLLDLDGNVIHEHEMVLAPIYMGQETLIQSPIPVAPPEGDYLLSFEFIDRESQISIASEEVAVNVPDASVAGVAPVVFENVVIEANADPIVFANVSVDVTLAQTTVRSSRLTLSVFHDGELVEDFVLAENLTLPQGTTTVTQRYLPDTNWESGTYTFSLKLEAIEGVSGTVLLEEPDVATLEVP